MQQHDGLVFCLVQRLIPTQAALVTVYDSTFTAGLINPYPFHTVRSTAQWSSDTQFPTYRDVKAWSQTLRRAQGFDASCMHVHFERADALAYQDDPVLRLES